MLSSVSTPELIELCAASADVEAWHEFIRRFHRVIAAVIVRTAQHFGEVPPEAVDDLIQETYFKLCANDCKLLRNFKPTHADAFFGFVKAVAANLARDHFKSEFSEKRGGHLMANAEFSEAVADSSLDSDSAGSITREILLREIDLHLRTFSSGPEHRRNCRIFWLYYRIGLSASAIGALPEIGLSTKGVESVIGRLTRELRVRMSTRKVETPGPAANAGAAEGKSPSGSF